MYFTSKEEGVPYACLLAAPLLIVIKISKDSRKCRSRDPRRISEQVSFNSKSWSKRKEKLSSEDWGKQHDGLAGEHKIDHESRLKQQGAHCKL